jgi:hypothetical protein
MKGWQTRTFTEKSCLHHRPMGTGSATYLRGIYRHGRKDYMLGGHPLWQAFRCAYQATRRPYVVGSLCLAAGYVAAALGRPARPVPPDLIRFHRSEQMARLRRLFRARPQGQLS